MDRQLWVEQFKEKLARQREERVPVTITRGGRSVQIYLPKEPPSEADLEAWRLAGERIDEMIKAAGTSEEELMEDFERLRREDRARKS